MLKPLLIAVSSLAACGSSSKSVETAPAPIVEPAPALVEEPAPTPVAAEWTTLTFPISGFTVEVPPGWLEGAAPVAEDVITLTSPDAPLVMSLIVLRFDPVSAATSHEAMSTDAEGSLGITFAELDPLRINDMQVRMSAAQATGQDGETWDIYLFTYLATSDTHVHLMMTGPSSTSAQYQAEIQRIMESISAP